MPKSVLLVEDEDNIALAVEFLLGRQGLRLRRVSDGEAALEALEEEVPDLVVLDIMLPRRSGLEVCEKIRGADALRSVKVLMMTARGGEIDRKVSVAAGADAFLTKPFAPQDLADCVTTLLGEGPHG